jgi:hypothetical protein
VLDSNSRSPPSRRRKPEKVRCPKSPKTAKDFHCPENKMKNMVNKVVIRLIRPEFKFPNMIEMALSQIIAIRE